MSEDEHSKTFRRLAFLERLAKLARQLEQKREAIVLLLLSSPFDPAVYVHRSG